MSTDPLRLPAFLQPLPGDRLVKLTAEGQVPAGTLADYLGNSTLQLGDGAQLVLTADELVAWDTTPSPAVGLSLEFLLREPGVQGVKRLTGTVEELQGERYSLLLSSAHTADGLNDAHRGTRWLLPRGQVQEIRLPSGLRIERELLGGAPVYLLVHRTDYGTYIAHFSRKPPSALFYGESVMVDGMKQPFDTVEEALAAARAEFSRKLQGAAPAPVPSAPAGSPLERNRRAVVEFFELAFNQGQPTVALERFAGEGFIQHNPRIRDGKPGFVEYFEYMARQYPGKRAHLKRVMADADLVMVHTHQIWPGLGEWAAVDIFRVDEQGRIVEHWDVLQQVPATAAHANTMF